MNDYEILLMLDPELPEERQSEILARTQELVTREGGTWESSEPWGGGRRRLAYEIDHKSEGVYHLLLFSSTAETLDEVSRVLKITDGVMRHMATRRPKPHRRSPATAAAVAGQASEPSPTAEGEA
ncbi:MAG TPA: 30S ribosomal protein S6 [Gaiellaceae bacterium]|nr:30S ribosomal protein S6 [Gaiellaceae bacterium]